LRDRNRIISNLEGLYRGSFQEAQDGSDNERMSKLDFEFQRDQLLFEVLLDIRDALRGPEPGPEGRSLLEKAEELRRITRLR
jgi:hypothetical protein